MKHPAGVGSLAAYCELQQVGEGTFGYVYKATDRRNGQPVALKRLIFHKKISGFPLPAVREVKFLKSLKHINIVQLLDIITSKGCEHIERFIPTDTNRSFDRDKLKAAAAVTTATVAGTSATTTTIEVNNGSEKHSTATTAAVVPAAAAAEGDDDVSDCEETSRLCGNIYLVFEFVDHDLGGLLDSKYKFQEREIKCIMKQLLEVLDYLADRRVLHRDIKCSNILLSNRHHVKLADFGLARSIASSDFGLTSSSSSSSSNSSFSSSSSAAAVAAVDLTNNVITLWYKPPELLLGAVRYGPAVDMWSSGCVMAELEAGRPLFPGRSEVEQFELISRALGTPSEVIWPGIRQLPHYEALLGHSDSNNNSSSYNNSYSGGATLRSTLSVRGVSSLSIGLLERMLALDPARRSSPRIALAAKYFTAAPAAPKDPAELPPLQLAAGESCHEFKMKRMKRLREQHGADAASATDAVEAEQQRQKTLAAAAAAAMAPAATPATTGAAVATTSTAATAVKRQPPPPLLPPHVVNPPLPFPPPLPPLPGGMLHPMMPQQLPPFVPMPLPIPLPLPPSHHHQQQQHWSAVPLPPPRTAAGIAFNAPLLPLQQQHRQLQQQQHQHSSGRYGHVSNSRFAPPPPPPLQYPQQQQYQQPHHQYQQYQQPSRQEQQQQQQQQFGYRHAPRR